MSGGPAGRSELVRWLACAAAVVLAHASAAAFIASRSDPVGSGEPSGAITVDLAPLVTSTSAAQDDVAPGPQMNASQAPPVETTEQTPEETPPEKPPEPTVVARQEIEPAPVEPPPFEQPAVEPAPPAMKPEVVAPPPRPKQARHREKPKHAKPAAPATTAPQRAPHLAAVAAAPSQGQPSASADAMQTWRGQIFAAVARQKRADSQTAQGRPVVAFAIDRHGHLLASSLKNSSGVAVLDQEALAMVRRAQPFPPAPADVIGTSFDISIPINFTLR